MSALHHREETNTTTKNRHHAGERLEEILEFQPPARLVALVPIGLPAELPAHKRLPLEEVLTFL